MQPTSSTLLLLAVGFTLWGPMSTAAAAQSKQEPKPAADTPSNERLIQAWSYLSDEEQLDASEMLRAELEQLGTFQQSLIDFALTLEPRDQGQLPLETETPFYSPEVHAPRQPIARVRLAADDPRAIQQRKTMLAIAPATGLDSAWRYDWALREVVRTQDDRDPTRMFLNAIAGFPPNLDFGVALIERALDDGKEQAALTAFGHAYTDRAGAVFPGLTLYDAWASGAEMEMPDVDVLGVIHDLDNDWKTWIAPVPDTRHEKLYGKVVEHFLRAKCHRELRTALATTFLSGSIKLRAGYTAHGDRLHSWWDERSSTPTELQKDLPASTKCATFLEKWAGRIDANAALTQRGIGRRATLDSDAAKVRAKAIDVLKEFGALERKARPPIPPAPAPEDKHEQGR